MCFIILHCALFIVHVLHINRVHAKQVQKSFNINYSGSMYTLCHTVCCMLHIRVCAVEQTML